MALDDAERVHRPQVEALAAAGVDLITAITMTTSAEAIGVARAAARAGRAVGDLVHGRNRRHAAERRVARSAIDAVDADAAEAGRASCRRTSC